MMSLLLNDIRYSYSHDKCPTLFLEAIRYHISTYWRDLEENVTSLTAIFVNSVSRIL